jgi:hypothetical protein
LAAAPFAGVFAGVFLAALFLAGGFFVGGFFLGVFFAIALRAAIRASEAPDRRGGRGGYPSSGGRMGRKVRFQRVDA